MNFSQISTQDAKSRLWVGQEIAGQAPSLHLQTIEVKSLMIGPLFQHGPLRIRKVAVFAAIRYVLVKIFLTVAMVVADKSTLTVSVGASSTIKVLASH